ncbi:MAG: hypothetical protein WC373_06575 [Smithella sp.]|jgi:hypothetical protein
MRKGKHALAVSILMILPVIFILCGLNFNRTWFSGDPEYAYLLNGINIADLKMVGHTDNPGTTVQIYSAVVLSFSHFLNSSEKNGLRHAVLKNPDHYVELERKVSVIINGTMILVLGVVSFFFLKNIWLSLILQITPFLSSNLLEHAWTKVSPEPALVFTVAVFVIALLAYYCSVNRQCRFYPWIFALICGFGLATKMTFLPLMIIPLILLEGRKQKWIYLSAIILFFIFFTIPAIPQYPHMVKWFLNLSTHTGIYGQGDIGVISPLRYINDIGAILKNNIALTVGILTTLTLLFILFLKGNFRNRMKMHSELKFAAAVLTAQLLGILMVAKHYHSNHYLIPEISLIGLLMVFVILCLGNFFIEKRVWIFNLLSAGVLCILITISLFNIPCLVEADHGYRITNEEYSLVMRRIEKEYPGYVKTYYYPTSINPYSALRWGSVYSKQYNLPALCALYPDVIFYDTRINAFQLWETEFFAKDLVREYGRKILLIGGPMTSEEKEKVKKGGLALKELYFGRTQAVYEVDTANSVIFKGLIKANP